MSNAMTTHHALQRGHIETAIVCTLLGEALIND